MAASSATSDHNWESDWQASSIGTLSGIGKLENTTKNIVWVAWATKNSDNEFQVKLVSQVKLPDALWARGQNAV